ncbi:hypothetical protein [Sansalvadorimonas verongulae]|uniref:hypothetical protein n=1 Tax=Sansalvadorimonas verongulae TaxID=2172824 RepID=UPI0012BBAF63|nr:hypothetical protein [Sansalvadorimonas verongulae]MTI13035.1 hypothetical protein [Sansalvadorimonas verongulae]
MPAVKAILPDGATVTSFNNQLILSVTHNEQKTVEELLQQIDKASRQFLISVRMPQHFDTSSDGVSVSGTFGNGRVQIGESSHPARVVIRSNSSSVNKDGLQSLRATEGIPAYIAVGTSKPVTTHRIDSFGNRQAITEYKAADQGFYVTARLVGEGGQLKINQTDDQHESQSISTRHLSTTVSGKLGEWITIGGTGTDRSDAHSGLVIRNTSSQNSSRAIQLRVEMVGK